MELYEGGEKMKMWTLEDALAWVLQVEEGKAPRGLRYCSAVSFLRGVTQGKKRGME